MSFNMYIKFEGPSVTGSSTDQGHVGAIEVLSWDHGFGQPTGPTRGGDRAEHRNFTFTKYLDSSTNELLTHCWNARQFDKVTLQCYRSDGTSSTPVPYLAVRMKHVIISNFAISGGPGDVPIENVSLDYGVIDYDYMPRSQASVFSATNPAMLSAPDDGVD